MTLTARLQKSELLIVPGVYDALTAVLVERCGYEAMFVSGAALAQSRLGRPDIGLLTATELVQAVAGITDRTDLPVLVDGDNGFGHAFHVARTVRQLEQAGAALIQLEDQKISKGLNPDLPRPLIGTDVMVGKLQAALDARHNAHTLISARTDALFSQGVAAAIDRAEAYRAAGADLLFIEGARSDEDLKALKGWAQSHSVPVVFNKLQAAAGPSEEFLQQAGFSVLLRPDLLINEMVQAGARALSAAKPGKPTVSKEALAQSAAQWVDGSTFVDQGMRFTPVNPDV